VREVARWAVPGFLLAGPLHLFLDRLHAAPSWPLWLVAAPVLGFAIQQAVRSRFEAGEQGYRSPRRAALAEIIARGNLEQRRDCGDIAYQVYEVVFYQRPDWRAARDHEHRARDSHFLCWSAAAASAAGAALSLLGFGAHPALATLYFVGLAPAAVMLRRKGQQTLDALELFDRALVATNWSDFDAVLRAITARQTGSAAAG